MSRNTYKKRAKGSWCQGKGYKGDSEERQYAKIEIEESIKYDQEDNLVKHKKKRKRNDKAALEHRIEWYKQLISQYKLREGNSDSFINCLTDGLKQAEKEYEEKYKESK